MYNKDLQNDWNVTSLEQNKQTNKKDINISDINMSEKHFKKLWVKNKMKNWIINHCYFPPKGKVIWYKKDKYWTSISSKIFDEKFILKTISLQVTNKKSDMKH